VDGRLYVKADLWIASESESFFPHDKSNHNFMLVSTLPNLPHAELNITPKFVKPNQISSLDQ
jgi:hypothetical protein